MNRVYINKLSRFLPNKPISNDEMEEFLGEIEGVKSRAKAIILRNNGIKTRYYAVDNNGEATHTNAELAYEAIKRIEEQGFSLNKLELLAIGTTSADQLLPSHASMVHGLMKNRPMEVISPQGSCNSGMLGLQYAFMSIATGNTKNAISGGSELLSTWLQASNYEKEAEKLIELSAKPYLQFEMEFLRWMLSDGAAVGLLENKPNENSLSLRIDFIDILSFAHEMATCMYAGAEAREDGELIPWKTYSEQDIAEKSILAIKQDTRLLGNSIVEKGVEGIVRVSEKYNFTTDKIDYFLPHMSSEFFRTKIHEQAIKMGVPLDKEKWFTNLTKFGNVGSASAFLMLEELFNSNKLKKGNTILIMSPESARFSYAYVKLTVV